MVKIKKVHKHPFTLLEVLIAFFLIAMCALPLIYPHAVIYKQTKEFAQEVDLDRVAGVIYSAVLDRLYHQKYEWGQIDGNIPFSMDDDLLKEAGISKLAPWLGEYWFEIMRQKSNTSKNNPTNEKEIVSVNLVAVHLDFKRPGQEKPFSYTYQAVVRRTIPNENVDESKEENPKTPPKDKP